MIGEMRERVAEQLYWQYMGMDFKGSLSKASDNIRYEMYARAVKIISLETKTCRIAVVRKEGELPQIPYSEESTYYRYVGWHQGVQDMLSAGFVQEIEKEAL